ncbi:MAG: DUF4097 domain-containing protein [Oscillospiraceae bacterium]|nr:DUF4097 domain-containing protein [Oscillospiraceae bacterium]
MENMRTKFIIAVTGRLSAAADSTAKVELIEELSENLFSRWQDLVGQGMDENAAYDKAMEDLGSVDELLAYLDSLGPEGELPRQEAGSQDFAGDLFRGMKDVFNETVHQTRDAVDQAKNILRDVEAKLKEKYPDGFKGKVSIHFDGDEDAAREAEAAEPGAEAAAAEAEAHEKGWSFSLGYNKDRGGFFCENSRVRRVEGTAFPSQALKGIDVQIVNGDVTVLLDNDPDADVRLDGDLENLELRMSDDGVLSVRQGNTASSSFFFLRGLAAADVELTLPRRFWDFLQISTVNGDVDVGAGLEAGQLSVKTSSGDAQINDVACQDLIFHSASGDMDGGGINSRTVVAETASGDVQMTGVFGTVKAATASGDMELAGTVRELRCSSASGDVDARLQQMPEQMELSSKSGDCQVSMPDGEGFTLQFSTVSGELDSDFPLVGPIGKRSGEAIYLDGGGRVFRVSSISGDITLRQR